jgi:hypothetical protein
MKESQWRQATKFKKHKKFAKAKYQKELDHTTVPQPPSNFSDLYKNLEAPSKPKGNNRSKPNRFTKQLKQNQEKLKEEDEFLQQEQQKEQEKLKLSKKKKKFSRLLSQKNFKGQPNLSNTLIHLFDKLKHPSNKP